MATRPRPSSQAAAASPPPSAAVPWPPWHWALCLEAPMSLGTYSSLPTLSNHGSCDCELGNWQFCLHTLKRPIQTPGPALLGRPLWTARERSQRGKHTTQHCCLLWSFHLCEGNNHAYFPTVPSPAGRNQQVSTVSLPAHCEHGRRCRPIDEVVEKRHEKHFADIL